MGGDNAPRVEVEGAVLALRELPPGFRIQLVGRTADIEAALKAHGAVDRSRLEVVEAPEVVGMGEKPLAAVKGKPRSSIAVGLGLQKKGESDAFISAGNTGAVMAAATLLLRLHEGVQRAAIGPLFPTAVHPVLVIDGGANVDCDARELVGFAHLGSIYVRDVLDRPQPGVGLLNVGEEDEKGNAVVKEAHQLLLHTPSVTYVGNVEGRDILAGQCKKGRIDVVVCDGFVGNVVLKFYESAGRMFMGMLKQAFPDVLGRPEAKQLFKFLDSSDQWIRERTGIRERRVAGPDESNACMGKAAAEQVLQETGLTPLDIDALVVATCSPDRLLPSQACDLQALLGAKQAVAFDVQAACTGFLYALNVAEGLVASEQATQVLVVASEKLTSIMDWTDRATAVLFGDGAGATLVRRSTGGRGILGSYMKSDGALAQLLYRPGGGAAHPPDAALLTDHSYYIQMAGREVFKAAVLSMADACEKAPERAGRSASDIDLLIPHQANIRIIEATAKHAGLPMDKVYVNVDRYGNTSAASVAIALDEAVRGGRLQPGMKVMFCAFGAGFTWASLVVQW